MTYDFKKIREKFFPETGGQTRMAEILGINSAQIRKWESGERKPSLRTMEKIAKALSVSLDELRNIGSMGEKEGFASDSDASSAALSGYQKLIAELRSQIADRDSRIDALNNEIIKLNRDIGRLEGLLENRDGRQVESG